MIVCKFGGSATAREQALKNIKKLADGQERKILVFSAIGREDGEDDKLTDLLIKLAENINNEKIITNIENKLNKLKKILNLKINIKKLINNFLNKYKKEKDYNYLISRGEYITSYMMAKYLNYVFIPAEKLIYFRKNKINYKKIKEKLKFYLKKYKKIVIPGFYGVDENRKIILFSRGGSDVSGAIIARCSNADIYENWTDEDGIKEVNPSICLSSTIFRMPYSQLKIMTAADAKVIHEDCADILKNRGITLKVANILNINSAATYVCDEAEWSFFVCFKEKGEGFEIITPQGSEKVPKGLLEERVKEIYQKKRR